MLHSPNNNNRLIRLALSKHLDQQLKIIFKIEGVVYLTDTRNNTTARTKKNLHPKSIQMIVLPVLLYNYMVNTLMSTPIILHMMMKAEEDDHVQGSFLHSHAQSSKHQNHFHTVLAFSLPPCFVLL